MKKDEHQKDQKVFDGRANFAADDNIEGMLEAHFEKFNISKKEIWRNFSIYTRPVFLKRYLAHYELFKMIQHLPGDIVELGVYRGASLLAWANFLEIRNMGDRAKKVIGFDNFVGFTEVAKEDGAESERFNKVVGGFDGGAFKEQLLDVISIFDADRFIGYKPKIDIVEGDVEITVEKYIKDNPGLRISLLHFDCDMYKPTMAGLKHLWPLVVKGGLVVFDEYAIQPWEGESNAVDEFFEGQNIKLQKFDWSTNPGAYLIKE